MSLFLRPALAQLTAPTCHPKAFRKRLHFEYNSAILLSNIFEKK